MDINIINLINNCKEFEKLEDLIFAFENSNSSLKNDLEIDFKSSDRKNKNPNNKTKTVTFDTVEHWWYSKDPLFNGHEIYFSKLKFKRKQKDKDKDKDKDEDSIYKISSIEIFTDVNRENQKLELKQYLIIALTSGDSKTMSSIIGKLDDAKIPHERLKGDKGVWKLIKCTITAKEFFEKI